MGFALLILAGVAVVAFVVLVVAGNRASDSKEEPNQEQIDAWCEAIASSVGPEGLVGSFVELPLDLEALRIPVEPAPATEEEHAAFSQAHPEYVASSFIVLLRDVPPEIALRWASLSADLEAAQKAQPPSEHFAENAAVVERYRSDHCG